MFVEKITATDEIESFDIALEYAKPPLSRGVHQICSRLFRGAMRDVDMMVRTLASSHPQLGLIQHGENALGWISGESAPLSFDDVCWGLGKDAEAARLRLKCRLQESQLIRPPPFVRRVGEVR